MLQQCSILDRAHHDLERGLGRRVGDWAVPKGDQGRVLTLAASVLAAPDFERTGVEVAMARVGQSGSWWSNDGTVTNLPLPNFR